ncbi:MAG: hypothetical protein ABSB74_05635 [Tepidisphaeraceae bacterium]
MPTKLRTHLGRSAFTIVELLVVIGIIVVLMGILFPVISRIRRAAQVADTQNELSQIANACNAYYSTFNAYPGPLSNDYIEGVTQGSTPALPALHPLELYTSGVYSSAVNYNITGTENLVLGLMGGLRLNTASGQTDNSATPPTPYVSALAATEVGLGPLNLNPNFPGRTPSFFPNGTTYLMWCERLAGRGMSPAFQTTTYQAANAAGVALVPAPFVDAVGTQTQGSPIPEFVDRFPTPGPLPILYLRARTGAKGVVSNGVITDPTNAVALYQYDVRDIVAYTHPNPTSGNSIGLGSYNHAPLQHNLQDIHPPGTAASAAILKTAGPPPVYYTIKDFTPYNAGAYFFNSAIPPTDTSSDNNCNYSGRPRAVDQFILISAGPDGIYGTADDITSFGDVSQ